jgi:two-component system, OmpR family, KDP operon response regulator KdpE
MTKTGEHVLVVDDEPQILRALGVILRNAGYQVDTAATKSEALDAVSVRPPDAMVLDLVLPDGSGVDVTSEVRTWSNLPIIVLSAVGDEREKVRALDVGADDYITKPFGTEELLARLRAAMRRAGDERDDPEVKVGALAIDLADRRVARDGEEVHLTPIEFDILRELARHAGKLVTQRQLLQAVWGPGYDLETHYLRVHVAHIRAKIEPDPSHPSYLITEPGVGYRLREPPS